MTQQKSVAITGATGFIGRALTSLLTLHGYSIVALTRRAEHARNVLPRGVTVIEWDGASPLEHDSRLLTCQTIVNLMGESIGGLWTASKRRELSESRIRATRALVDAARSMGSLRCFIQASAVGYYGPHGDEELLENAPSGDGFLAEVARSAEAEAAGAASSSVRLVVLRTGLVLGSNGGMLGKMVLPVRLGVGGYPGKGTQWFSWVHVDDETAAIQFLLEHTSISGPVNITSPNPVRMKDFIKAAGRVLRRPVWMPVPAFALRAALGRLAEETLLSGQRVLPQRLLESGFAFRFALVDAALTDLLVQSRTSA